MKYVIFKRGSLFLPVIIPEHVTHSEVRIEGAIPVSAGFCHTDEFVIPVVGKEGSDSLNLNPAPGDTSLLTAVLCNGTMSFFLDTNEIERNHDEGRLEKD